MPALITAIVAVLLSRENAAPLAYIAGSLGTLIGADLTNLDKVRGLGAPVASIGGAGTFDGIFLTGILAVLLASLYHPGIQSHRRRELVILRGGLSDPFRALLRAFDDADVAHRAVAERFQRLFVGGAVIGGDRLFDATEIRR